MKNDFDQLTVNMMEENELLLTKGLRRFESDFERVVIEKARRIDELMVSVLPEWGKGVYHSKLPSWLRLTLLKHAARRVNLRIIENPMAGITEVWAHGKKVGEVGMLQVMDDLKI